MSDSPSYGREMKISIVMPSYNQGDYVEYSIKSVLSQSYKNYEIIFVDGGSDDETIAKVEPFRDRIAHFVSEPDFGQSHALSKGFALASGDVLTWLNTDDVLLPGALSSVIDLANASARADLFLGNVVWIDSRGEILRCRRGGAYKSSVARVGALTVAGPSAFFTHSLYERIGGINQNLHYKMDTEFLWRCVLSGSGFERLKSYTWGMRIHANSKTSGHLFESRDAEKRAEVARAQFLESEIIDDLLRAEGVCGSMARKVYTNLSRMFSPAYFLSVVDSKRWSGRNLGDIFRD